MCREYGGRCSALALFVVLRAFGSLTVKASRRRGRDVIHYCQRVKEYGVAPLGLIVGVEFLKGLVESGGKHSGVGRAVLPFHYPFVATTVAVAGEHRACGIVLYRRSCLPACFWPTLRPRCIPSALAESVDEAFGASGDCYFQRGGAFYLHRVAEAVTPESVGGGDDEFVDFPFSTSAMPAGGESGRETSMNS